LVRRRCIGDGIKRNWSVQRNYQEGSTDRERERKREKGHFRTGLFHGVESGGTPYHVPEGRCFFQEEEGREHILYTGTGHAYDPIFPSF
jgi:hypothetical protein